MPCFLRAVPVFLQIFSAKRGLDALARLSIKRGLLKWKDRLRCERTLRDTFGLARRVLESALGLLQEAVNYMRVMGQAKLASAGQTPVALLSAVRVLQERATACGLESGQWL